MRHVLTRVIAISAALIGAALPLPAVARPALLMDLETSRIYFGEDIDQQWHPASLTKIMTAYLTFEALKSGAITLDTKITSSEAALAQPPSKLGLPLGGQITVEVALKALIIKSANDVAVMLAEAIGGSEAGFVERMNKTAARLGMSRTRFVNPNGLPAAEQVTTARDLARLSRAVIKDHPQYAAFWAEADMKIGRRRIGTHNSLLKSYEGADGLKTGFICDSGFNVVATASRDGQRLVAVVLGESTARDRMIRAAALLEHGFQTSGWKALFNTDTIDSRPIAADAGAAVSIRKQVLTISCGGLKPVRVAKRKGPRAKNKTAAGARPASNELQTGTVRAPAAKVSKAP